MVKICSSHSVFGTFSGSLYLLYLLLALRVDEWLLFRGCPSWCFSCEDLGGDTTAYQIKGNCYEGSRGGVYQDIKTEPGAPEERWRSQFRSRTMFGALHHLGNYLLPPTMVRKRRLPFNMGWILYISSWSLCQQTHAGGFWQVEHAAELSISGGYFFMVWKHSDFTCTENRGEKLCTPIFRA